MKDLSDLIANLRRPRLLIRAARFGQTDYNRARDLRRLMQAQAVPGPEQALERLIEEEAKLEASRQEGAANYSLMRHIELLIAMMAEARLLPRPPQAI
ncbi:hypothetical protein LPB142_08820 [Rhodobacter xanthinilyticus]|uniref:Uncharacterized protein n=1 Tax=Rhodobacter xanthinilyticus TaxID=1850250 RepID=A0A1D9MC22_9RHOB|nr:DUF6477 family protein [Rhodobacter xanthinilyticus]AOZ69402.1 hypothetical protein LPB142_08820 [Rhodobacter xanthinilyticus]